MKLISLIAGGAIGTIARYYTSVLASKVYAGIFPVGTLMVNIAGSFIIGLIWGLWEDQPVSPALRTFVIIGILGGFTTFSSFAIESLNLFRTGHAAAAITYILASNLGGLACAYLGFLSSRSIRLIL